MSDRRERFRATLTELDLSAQPAEASFRQRMLTLLDGAPDCFWRTAFPGHFTGSALVVSADGARALLHHHRKLDRWLQFGGHCDGQEDVLRVAAREALEESGIAGLRAAFDAPFDLDIHEIPARKDEPAHWHYDVRYLFLAPPGAVGAVSAESHALRWLTPAEAERTNPDPGLRRLFQKWVAWRSAHADSMTTP